MTLAIETESVGNGEAPLKEIQLRAILFKLKLDVFKRIQRIRLLRLKCHKAQLGVRYLKFRIHIAPWWAGVIKRRIFWSLVWLGLIDPVRWVDRMIERSRSLPNDKDLARRALDSE